jgi:serine protease Do
MRTHGLQRAGVALLVAGTHLGDAAPQPVQAEYPRRSPVVEAVRKTRDAIVTIKISASDAEGGEDVFGTGVVIDERGLVLTNRHVVSTGRRSSVRLSDGIWCPARVHVELAECDLAVLKLEVRRTFQALAFAPCGDLMVGETVIAVGNPFGYTHSVTTGVISALGREITMRGLVLKDVIQVSASINPGNSGGPLLNVNGELIGINVAVRRNAQGIGFALNGDRVQESLRKSLSAGKVANLADHGMTCATRPDAGAARWRVAVEGVAVDSPSASAGLRKGDLLLAVGGRAVNNGFDVERALWDARPGRAVPLLVLRGGRDLKLELTLGAGAAPEPSGRGVAGAGRSQSSSRPRHGTRQVGPVGKTSTGTPAGRR